MLKTLIKQLNLLRASLKIRAFRSALSSLDAAPQFAILGILSGVFTGLVILLFRVLVEQILKWVLPNGPESFEQLASFERFLLPTAGAMVLALIFALLRQENRGVGVSHVLERLHRHQGYLSFKNLLVQFFTGAIALVTGQTGGREGPAIHLGASISSLLGQTLKLPNNSIRVLIGCGTAAAIGSSFNTPIAGVIFSMEVIVLEYTIAGFMPVILAAVTGTLVVQQVFGDDPVFFIPGIAMDSYWDLPWIFMEGIVIAVLAAALIRLMVICHSRAPKPIAIKIILAGLVTATLGLVVPEVLGIGYDTVNQALQGNLPLMLLLVICGTKLITTAINLGLGMPIGLIGPTLMIGAMAGGGFWQLASTVSDQVSAPRFYVILGMGAMMGAALQAPLAALMALMELTRNPEIVLPAMLCIVIANITAAHGFGAKSIFQTQALMLGIDLTRNSRSLALSRASVESRMSRKFIASSVILNRGAAERILQNKPNWILVKSESDYTCLLKAADLQRALTDPAQETFDLREIPADRKDIARITWQATLDEAFDIISRDGVQALYVVRVSATQLDRPVGILLPEDIENYYHS
ncbi:MAG: chloride channel protein [Pseudomonadales bacterium]